MRAFDDKARRRRRLARAREAEERPLRPRGFLGIPMFPTDFYYRHQGGEAPITATKRVLGINDILQFNRIALGFYWVSRLLRAHYELL